MYFKGELVASVAWAHLSRQNPQPNCLSCSELQKHAKDFIFGNPVENLNVSARVVNNRPSYHGNSTLVIQSDVILSSYIFVSLFHFDMKENDYLISLTFQLQGDEMVEIYIETKKEGRIESLSPCIGWKEHSFSVTGSIQKVGIILRGSCTLILGQIRIANHPPPPKSFHSLRVVQVENSTLFKWAPFPGVYKWDIFVDQNWIGTSFAPLFSFQGIHHDTIKVLGTSLLGDITVELN